MKNRENSIRIQIHGNLRRVKINIANEKMKFNEKYTTKNCRLINFMRRLRPIQ